MSLADTALAQETLHPVNLNLLFTHLILPFMNTENNRTFQSQKML